MEDVGWVDARWWMEARRPICIYFHKYFSCLLRLAIVSPRRCSLKAYFLMFAGENQLNARLNERYCFGLAFLWQFPYNFQLSWRWGGNTSLSKIHLRNLLKSAPSQQRQQASSSTSATSLLSLAHFRNSNCCAVQLPTPKPTPSPLPLHNCNSFAIVKCNNF